MKRYLGDGVYVDFDGFQIVLSTEDGLRTTNTICLEPGVYTALLGYVEMLKKIEEPKAEADADSELVMWDSSKPGNEGY